MKEQLSTSMERETTRHEKVGGFRKSLKFTLNVLGIYALSYAPDAYNSMRLDAYTKNEVEYNRSKIEIVSSLKEDVQSPEAEHMEDYFLNKKLVNWQLNLKGIIDDSKIINDKFFEINGEELCITIIKNKDGDGVIVGMGKLGTIPFGNDEAEIMKNPRILSNKKFEEGKSAQETVDEAIVEATENIQIVENNRESDDKLVASL